MNRISTGRRGVILLVILGMLALFMLVGVSFVVTSTHARSSALATLSIEQTGDSPDREISMALLNVVRGSRSPRSAIGPHSILEDMFGERDAVVGVVRFAADDIVHAGNLSSLAYTPTGGMPIFPQSTYTGTSNIVATDSSSSYGELVPVLAISLGPDRVPGVPGVDDDNNGVVDDNYDAVNQKLSIVSGDDFYLGHQVSPGFSSTSDTAATYGMGADAVMGHYAGRLFTMLDGPLARQSTRIVWSYPVTLGSTCYWVLVLRPFSPGLPSELPYSNGAALYNVKMALANRRFVINGRPFNGQGFGYNPLNGMQPIGSNGRTAGPPINPRLLNLTHSNLDSSVAVEQAFPFALLPNPTDRRYRDYLTDRSSYISSATYNTVLGATAYTATNTISTASPLTNPFGVDADEDYDAPDYQNLHMAWRVWNPMMGAPVTHTTTTAPPGGRWQTRIPSFHRPELVNYWLQNIQAGNLMSYGIPPVNGSFPSWYSTIPGGESMGGNIRPRLRQRIILRPDPQDNFDPLTQDTNGNGMWDAALPFSDTNGNGIWDVGEPTQNDPSGSTPAQPAEPDWSGNMYFNPINGPWDVDNDNDGEADSIWLDLGSPVQSTADGKQYKPLFAVLCLDMDGRLNINAHGNNSHVNWTNYTNSAPLAMGAVPAVPATSIPADSVILGMWQVRGYPGQTPRYTRIQSVGPFAGGWQNPAYYTTAFISPPNTPSLSLGTGLGFSVADINLGPLLTPPFITDLGNGTGSTFNRYENQYRYLLQGVTTAYGNPKVAVTSLQHLGQPMPGRYGELHLLNYSNPMGPVSNLPPMYPQAGVTYGQQGGNGTYTPFGPVYDSYDDNVPAAGSTLNQVYPSAIALRGDSFQATLPTYWNSTNASQWVNPNLAQANTTTGQGGVTTQGAYGSPVDPYGCLMVGLDFRGQPVYANLPYGKINVLIDDPWELDLSPKGKRTSYALATNNTKWPFDSDTPFTPGELETLLRYGDPDLATLQSRPVQIFALNTQDSAITNNLRNRVTTESWDLPCPNIQPTPEIVRGLQMLGLPTTNCSFADLVRGKIAFVQGLSIDNNRPSLTNPGALALANEQALLLLNGRVIQVKYINTTAGSTPVTYYARVLPAFSSDLLMGLRMNLNRTLGNSWDDNGNGAIDDPDELTGYVGYPERLWRLMNVTTGLPNTSTGYQPDPNNDGVPAYQSYPTPLPVVANPFSGTTLATALPAFDVNARAEMAKNLYMLMMLLTDSDWKYWYPTTQAYLPGPVNGVTTPPVFGTYATVEAPNVGLAAGYQPFAFANVINNPALNFTPGASGPYVMNARQKLAAYRIAQWAVNAVDFADRDAIMTGFEFDLAPFNLDGYSVDGNLASYYSYWQTNPTAGVMAPYTSYFEPDRGVVWGMEYPDLLLTETTAFHDKGWADTMLDTTKQKNGQGTAPNKDYDWDQVRLPQGSLFVELYCPGKPNSQSWPTWANQNSYPPSNAANNNSPYLPAELYDVVTPVSNYGVGTYSNSPSYKNVGATQANVGTLDLERMTPLSNNINGAQQWPVWRLALAKGTTTPRPGVGTLNPKATPLVTPPAATYSNNLIYPNGSQSLQNRFMTRPDTTTVLPLTSLSASYLNSSSAYSQRHLALNTANPPVTTAIPTPAQLDSYVVTDFIDTNGTNLPNHVMFLQRYVYFCRPMLNAPNPSGVFPPTINNAYPKLAYAPYSPAANASMNTAVSMPSTGATAQTIYQFRPQNTNAQGGAATGNTQPRLLLHPGSYAVVGPRRSSHSPAKVTPITAEDVTFIGYNDGQNVKTTVGTPAIWYPQAIDLQTHYRPYHLLNPVMMLSPANGHPNYNPTTITGSPTTNYGGYPDSVGFMTTKIKNPLCIPCASGAPWPVTSAAATTQVDRGLNISEPPQGYTIPTTSSLTSTSTYTSGNQSPGIVVTATVTDAFANPKSGSGPPAMPVPNNPFDAPVASQGQSYEPWSAGASALGTGTCSRTLIDYSTVFLQRLADPTRPWEPTVNPYLTIDWMPIDLTVFNGQNVFQGAPQSMFDASNQAGKSGTPANTTAAALFAFETRQRGPRNMVQSSTQESIPATSNANVTLALPTYLTTGTTVTYYQDPGNAHRWPVTYRESLPFQYVLSNPSGTAPPNPLPSVWPQLFFNPNYGNNPPQAGYNGEYQAVTEAPLWCQMSDDPRANPTQTQGQYQKPSPIMGSGASFTAYLYGTLGFLNEGYGLVDFNRTPAVPASPSAIDAYNANSFVQRLAAYYGGISGNSSASPMAYALNDYVGDPARPFPWLTWNNRPYASAMELLLVPASQPARFGWEFNYKTAYTDSQAMHPDPWSMPNAPAPATGGVLWDSHYAWRPNPSWGGFRPNSFNASNNLATGPQYYPPTPALNINASAGSSFMSWPSSSISAVLSSGGYPFGHLLNFFGSNGPQACTSAGSYNYTAATASSTGVPIDPLVGYAGTDPNFGNGNNSAPGLPAVQPSSNFHRIFEYVHVPSRFSGTEELLDPAIFYASSVTAHSANPNSAMSHFLAPFNRVSRYREPGKVNLNTISDTWLKGNVPSTVAAMPAPYWFAHQPDIFQGMMNDFPGYKYIWDNLLGGLQIQDPRGADKAWGFARNYVNPSISQPSPTGDDDGHVSTYGFGQADDQWEAGWPGPSGYNVNGFPMMSGGKASDDWIPVSPTAAGGQQTLIVGAPNERLLNHLAYNPAMGLNYTGPTGPSTTYPDLPPGSGAYNVAGNVGMPTFFPNPFRSFCTSFGVPVPQMLYWWPAVPAMGGGSGLTGNGGTPLNGNSVGLTTYPMPFYWADSSLFRRSRVHPTRRYEPLLVYNSYNWWSPGISGVGNNANLSWETAYLNQSQGAINLMMNDLFKWYPYPDAVSRAAPHLMSGYSYQPSEWGEGFRDSNRNPYFRYQPLIKLGNMVTTRSNVYAIWVTVGYFEVRRAVLDQRNPQATFDRNPDGYRLVRELGSDTGNVKRHRGFAIFDRTLPMGFLRGENLNVNDGFLVKRTIE
ncbi:MAG TPA: hypothetical protein VHV55_24970 [Pirellulales bacterium]|jgi:hypothetical protein|nr:hypothetical protein [Pirellulales bacterium]